MTPTANDLSDFVIREARMLDEEKFEEWLDLFTEDGIYWMPLEVGQNRLHRLSALGGRARQGVD